MIFYWTCSTALAQYIIFSLYGIMVQTRRTCVHEIVDKSQIINKRGYNFTYFVISGYKQDW